MFRILVYFAVIYVTCWILPGVNTDSFWTAVVVALVLAILNFFVKPFLLFITIPVTVMTFGLFLFTLNAIILMSASYLVDGFVVDGFGWAVLGSIIISSLNNFFISD